MRERRRHRSLTYTTALALLAVLFVTALAGAADVSVGLSSREAEVGEPVRLDIEIEYEEAFEPPVLPEIDGVRVDESGSRRNSEIHFDGRRTVTTRSITFSYELTPMRVGTIEIPEFAVRADGRTFRSKPLTLAVNQGTPPPSTEDLAAIEVTANKQRVFVGEPVTLTMNLYVRAVRDRRLGFAATAQQTWEFIDLQGSRWGPFVEPLRELLNEKRRIPAGREVLRPDANGVERSYFRYRLSTEVRATRAGTLTFEPVRVQLEMPLKLERQPRGFLLDANLRVTRKQDVEITAETAPVEVLPPPAAGKPAEFRGAVGRFAIEATAVPTAVDVGDPITLTMTVRDLGRSHLEAVPPPPLAALDDLTTDFRIPNEPLAGVVQDDGRTKVFTQTLRAKRDDVTEIPSIPFAFFDPATESYAVVRTPPIPVEVQPTQTVSMGDIVGGTAAPANGGAATRELTEVSGGILANATDVEALLGQRTTTLGVGHLALLALPPIVFAGLLAGARIHRHDDERGRRRRRALRQATAAIQDTRNADETDQAERIAAAVRDYVADRFGLPAGALTRDEVARRLRGAKLDDEIVGRTETLLAECERVCYGGQANGESTSLADRARGILTTLERARLG